MKYNYISLKNGVLFRTQQNYTWVSSSRSGRSLVEMVKDGQETIPVDGAVLIPGIQGWSPVGSFKCDPDDIQATWKN